MAAADIQREQSKWRRDVENGTIGGGGGGVSATGTPVDDQIAVWDSASSIEGDANFTWDGSTLTVVGTIDVSVEYLFTERANHSFVPVATRGILWLRDDAPNTLIFTDDAGTDHVVGGASGVSRNTPFGIIGTATGSSNISLLELRESGDVNVQMRVGQSINGSNVSDVINTQSNGSVRIGTDNAGSTSGIDFLVANTPVANIDADKLRLEDDLDLVMVEKSNHSSSSGSGRALWWVRDDTPNIPIFTDDAGTDFELAGGYIRSNTATDAELDDITDAINTAAGKVQGAMIYNTTQDVPVWAVGNADGSIWVDGAGTTVNTPV